MSVLGDRIKEERKKLNLTREDLAKKIGVSYSAIAMYEQGNREPSNELAFKLCEIFDCSMDYLTGKSYYKNYEEFKKIDDFVLNYKRTPEETKIIRDVLNYVNAHPNETFEGVIEWFIQKLPVDKKEILKSILYHLHYRYHGTIPKNAECSTKDPKDLIIKTNKYYEDKYNLSQMNLIPIIGKIAAGKPILAEEYIEGYLPVDPNIYGMHTSEDLFYLKVSGESMNKIVKNGDYALIRKQNYAEDGDIIVAIVNGDDEATLKKYKKLNNQFILLEPMSTDSSIESITIDLKDIDFKIIGKAIGQFGKF